MSENNAVLLIHCQDQKGIVAAVTDFLLKNDANIVRLNQHVSPEENYFYMRVEWELDDFSIPKEKIHEYFQTLIGKKFSMYSRLHFLDQKPKVAVFVSKYSHCFYDILARHESGEWKIDIPLIISNHEKLRPIAERHQISYYCFEKNAQNKLDQEKKELSLLKKNKIDLIILARYMQILSSDFTGKYPNRIINIHHSSLPAFPGSNPYKSAFRRGVKFMGATAHYVTSDLDEGPIIAQDLLPISHRDALDDLKRKGRDVEKIVLAKAVWSHINNKVLVYNNKTVVFD